MRYTDGTSASITAVEYDRAADTLLHSTKAMGTPKGGTVVPPDGASAAQMTAQETASGVERSGLRMLAERLNLRPAFTSLINPTSLLVGANTLVWSHNWGYIKDIVGIGTGGGSFTATQGGFTSVSNVTIKQRMARGQMSTSPLASYGASGCPYCTVAYFKAPRDGYWLTVTGPGSNGSTISQAGLYEFSCSNSDVGVTGTCGGGYPPFGGSSQGVNSGQPTLSAADELYVPTTPYFGESNGMVYNGSNRYIRVSPYFVSADTHNVSGTPPSGSGVQTLSGPSTFTLPSDATILSNLKTTVGPGASLSGDEQQAVTWSLGDMNPPLHDTTGEDVPFGAAVSFPLSGCSTDYATCKSALESAGFTGTITHSVESFTSADLTKPASAPTKIRFGTGADLGLPSATSETRSATISINVTTNPSVADMPVRVPQAAPDETIDEYTARAATVGLDE